MKEGLTFADLRLGARLIVRITLNLMFIRKVLESPIVVLISLKKVALNKSCKIFSLSWLSIAFPPQRDSDVVVFLPLLGCASRPLRSHEDVAQLPTRPGIGDSSHHCDKIIPKASRKEGLLGLTV